MKKQADGVCLFFHLFVAALAGDNRNKGIKTLPVCHKEADREPVKLLKLSCEGILFVLLRHEESEKQCGKLFLDNVQI